MTSATFLSAVCIAMAAGGYAGFCFGYVAARWDSRVRQLADAFFLKERRSAGEPSLTAIEQQPSDGTASSAFRESSIAEDVDVAQCLHLLTALRDAIVSDGALDDNSGEHEWNRRRAQLFGALQATDKLLTQRWKRSGPTTERQERTEGV